MLTVYILKSVMFRMQSCGGVSVRFWRTTAYLILGAGDGAEGRIFKMSCVYTSISATILGVMCTSLKHVSHSNVLTHNAGQLCVYH